MKTNHESYTMHIIKSFCLRKKTFETSHTNSHTVHINRETYLEGIMQLAMILHQLPRNKKLYLPDHIR